jgi:acetolactate synthase-1/2/3 large subunit
VEALRIEKEEDILPALKKAAAAQKEGRTMVLEFIVATEEVVLPMVKGGMANSDMILK